MFKGAAKSIRFAGRGTGLLGSEELSDFNLEAELVDRAVYMLATDEAFRNEVANHAISATGTIELTSFHIEIKGTRLFFHGRGDIRDTGPKFRPWVCQRGRDASVFWVYRWDRSRLGLQPCAYFGGCCDKRDATISPT